MFLVWFCFWPQVRWEQTLASLQSRSHTAKQLWRDVTYRKPDKPAEPHSRAAVTEQGQSYHYRSNSYHQGKGHLSTTQAGSTAGKTAGTAEKPCATGQKKTCHTMTSLAKQPTGKRQVRLRRTLACHPVWCWKTQAWRRVEGQNGNHLNRTVGWSKGATPRSCRGAGNADTAHK